MGMDPSIMVYHVRWEWIFCALDPSVMGYHVRWEWIPLGMDFFYALDGFCTIKKGWMHLGQSAVRNLLHGNRFCNTITKTPSYHTANTAHTIHNRFE